MDYKKILEDFSLTKFPVALGGCRKEGNNFGCCEYNITVFDEKNEKDRIIEVGNEFVKIHHGSLEESRHEILVQYENLEILNDEQWELRIFLSKIKEKKEKIFKAYAKSCLIDAAVCATKTKDGLKNSDLFASSWIKCSAFFIADAISILNSKRPSPTHMLENLRHFEKNKINENFSIVNDSIGIERATPSLLSRMCKSTIGFSDMVEQNDHSKIIQKKNDYFLKNSLISDCYFYLGYTNRNNFIKIKDILHQKPELIHVLKVAFDVDNDQVKIGQQADVLHKTANDMITLIS
ncbi:MAG: hypothetical protein O6746_00290 [Thaumarchaeota archaeon]|nr:hypothetical protein [Nitrososphaerota archaeon]